MARYTASGEAGHGKAGSGEAGYNLVALAIAITILNIMVAAAMPMWSTAMQREKEEELIFRGFQYAEGIRLFQRRFGRLPIRLEEMIEVEPRCLRQLWEEPMSDNGKWGLIFANASGNPGQPPGQPQQGQPQQGQPQQAPPPGQQVGGIPEDDPGLAVPGSEDQETVTVGPITGVRSLSDEESLLEFNGQDTYDAWQFTVNMVSGGVGGGVRPGALPNLNVRWLGRPLRKGLAPQSGGLPSDNRNPSPNPRGGSGPDQEPDQSSDGRRRTLPNTIGGDRPN